MKKFSRKSEIDPVANRNLFRFSDETEKTTSIQMTPMPSSGDMITELARLGAKRILAEALECEIAEHLAKYEAVRDEHGHKQIVRNGHCKERKIVTGVGEVEVAQPRVRDRREKSERETFTSKILPPYLRKAKTVDEFIPILYLQGVSTGDMEPTLRALLGENAKGLSAQTVSRLKMRWKNEYETWNKRSLENKNYVYIWADGVYFTPRGGDGKVCMLVIIGVLEDGTKEVIAISDGHRECELSWREVLLGLKNRGLEHVPMLAIGDGALGFWNALRKIFPETKEQRCWFHKKGNVLTQLPDSLRNKGLQMLREIEQQPTRELSLTQMKHFENVFGAKYPKAVECLLKDKNSLLTFYDFPAEHWASLKTTNPIESMFATVKHRTYKSKGCGSRETYLAMVFKLTQQAQGRWRRINAPHLVKHVVAGVTFVNGEAVNPPNKVTTEESEKVTTKEKIAA